VFIVVVFLEISKVYDLVGQPSYMPIVQCVVIYMSQRIEFN